MMTLIIGGSGSGKSEYAENYITAVSGVEKKYYLATMRVFGQEEERKIQKHRQLRSGKGFITIEQPVSIEDALEKMEPEEPFRTENETEQTKNVALLECISNLTANEMFSGETPLPAEAVTEKIVEGVRRLKEGLAHLVIVSNNVFEDGIAYDETTFGYIRAMGRINENLAAMADEVIEVVVGIPVVVKEFPKSNGETFSQDDRTQGVL